MQFTVYTERQSNYPSTVSAHGEKTSVYGLWLPGSGQQQSIPEGKKYHCRACDYQATQKSHFTTHQKSIQEGKKYHCSVCDYRATTKSHLTRHHHSVHMGQKYQCSKCNSQFNRKDHLTTHLQSVHMGKKNIPVTCAVIMQLKKAILRDTRIECTRIMKY